ncbi:MAG: hypothetical protein KF756_00725 [Acidobacteria bacterium]|nr:hypothetical protein [Acidobacteriota bacterium]
MTIGLIENDVEALAFDAGYSSANGIPPVTVNVSQVLLETARWLGGVDVFASAGGRPFADLRTGAADPDLRREARILQVALRRCSHSLFMLILHDRTGDDPSPHLFGVATAALPSLSRTIRAELFRLDAALRGDTISAAEFRFLADALLANLRFEPAYVALVSLVDQETTENLPKTVRKFVEGRESSPIVDTIASFGRILAVLDLVGGMLERDEPMKPAVVLFAKAHAMTGEMIERLNRRVQRLGDAGGAVTDSLDGASYTAAVELKKAVAQELVGIMGTRSAVGVYARTEAAYAQLSESFQQIVTVLSRDLDDSVDPNEMFPNFAAKLEYSIRLRNELHSMAKLSRAAEENCDKKNAEALNAKLSEFSASSIRFLFYKDIETFERFVEEIRVTRQTKDLVPIIHRFGAYLETLFAQVNMRSVLEGHPFQP